VITPPIGFPMGGWSDQLHDRSIGNDLDLVATVLVVTDDLEAGVLADIDLCVITDRQARSMREAVSEAIGITPDAVRITATHNHSAPVTSELTGAGWMFDGLDDIQPYVDSVTGRLADAAKRAWSQLESVAVGHGAGSSPIAVNRRADSPSGEVRVGLNWTGVVDHTVRVARLDGATGKPLATIVHYSAHPTILAGGNRYINPEYPGHVRRIVEGSLGGHCLFLQGTCGDVGPIETLVSDLDAYRRLGTMLGHDAAAIAYRSAAKSYRQRATDRQGRSTWLTNFEYEPEPDQDHTVRIRSDHVLMPIRRDLGNPTELRRQAVALYEELRRALARRDPPDEIRELRVRTKSKVQRAERAEALTGLAAYSMEIHGLRIGPIAFVGAPIEPFVELGIAIAARSPFPQTFVSGYTNGYRSYLPTERERSRGGMEVDICSFAPGAANLYVDGSEQILERLAE
jgi:hypothetical protein